MCCNNIFPISHAVPAFSHRRGACNLSSTPVLFPKTRTEAEAPPTSPPSLPYSRIHEFRVSIKPDSYSNGRGELASHRRDQKDTIVVEVSRVAAGRRNGPSRCDSALLEIISSRLLLLFFFFPFLPPCRGDGFSLSSRRYIPWRTSRQAFGI